MMASRRQTLMTPVQASDVPRCKLYWYCEACGNTELYNPQADGPLGPWAESNPTVPRRLQDLLTRLRYAFWRRRRNACESSGRSP